MLTRKPRLESVYKSFSRLIEETSGHKVQVMCIQEL